MKTSMRSLGGWIVGAVMLSAVSASPAAANTIYTYTGATFDFCVIGTTTPCTPSGSITGTMEFSSPLAASLTGATVTPDAFSFSDGAGNITNSNWDAAHSFFQVTTDASGILTGWLINVLDSTDTRSIGAFSPIFPGGYSGSTSCPIGNLITGCTNAKNQAASVDGSWSAVPEPASLALVAAGLGALGAGRHRKQDAEPKAA